jgi:hypothetical protein
MQRRKALAVAGTIAATVTAAGAAMAVNVGLLGSSGPGSKAGQLDARNVAELSNAVAPPAAPTAPAVRVVDEYIAVPEGPREHDTPASLSRADAAERTRTAPATRPAPGATSEAAPSTGSSPTVPRASDVTAGETSDHDHAATSEPEHEEPQDTITGMHDDD